MIFNGVESESIEHTQALWGVSLQGCGRGHDGCVKVVPNRLFGGVENQGCLRGYAECWLRAGYVCSQFLTRYSLISRFYSFLPKSIVFLSAFEFTLLIKNKKGVQRSSNEIQIQMNYR